MKKTREWTEEEKRVVKEGIIVVVGANIILVIDFYLLTNFLFDAINLKEGAMSLFAGLRALLFVLYFIGFIPASVLAEAANSYVKKRQFRMSNIFIFLLFFAEFVLLASAISTLSDLTLSNVSMLVQFPLTALNIGISLLVLTATSRVKVIHDFVKRAFD